MKKQASLVSICVFLLTVLFCFSIETSAQTSPYCETEVQHLGIAAEVPSRINLTIANLDATSMIVEIESADADPVDFLLVNGGSGATISAEDFSVPGKISRTLTWAAPPANVVLNVLWSKASFPGNWQLSPADVTLAFADTCSDNPTVPVDTSTSTSPYCETEVQHLGIPAEVASSINLTIENLDATSMIVEIESATGDPVDFLLVNGGSGATISAEDFSVPGKISRTLSWAAPPDTVVLNVLWSKASFPGNWQLSPGDVFVAFSDTCSSTSSPPSGPSSTVVNFAVNMNGFTGSFGTVYVAGDFNGWCGGCNPLSDTDGDGIWTGTDTITQDSMEFKYQLDQWVQQENLTPGSPCTKTTGGFTNRFTLLPSGTVNLPAYCYSSCETVCVIPSLVKVAVDMNNHPVAFGTVFVAGEFNGWCGGCNPLSDPEGDGIWTGVIPTFLDSFEYKFQLDEWAQQEDLTPGSSCTKSTDGFTNRFVDLAGADTVCLDTVCYSECTECTTAPSTPKKVKVAVDMSQYSGGFTTVYIAGEFNAWCGGCDPLSDLDGDSIWTGCITTSLDSFEYKFQLDMWAAQENLDPVGDAACTKTTGGFTNRFVDLSNTTDTVCLDTVCYEACDACQPLAQPVDLTFIVDMSLQAVVNEPIHIVGPFNGFDPNADALTPIGNGKYSVTISGFIPGQQFNFKYLNGNSFDDAENVNSGPCAANNGFGDRTYVVPSSSDTVGPDCFNFCGPCQTPVDVTFIVDMSQEDSVNGTVYLVGPFNGFDPTANPMTPIGNGQYSTTISGLQPGSQINFKYLNGPSFDFGEFVGSGPCAADNGFGDRTLLIPSSDATVGPDCFGLCGACPIPPCPAPQNLTSTQLTASTASLSWDPAAGADNYVIRGNKTGSPGFVFLQAANPPKTVGGLDMNSSYFWQVQSICSGNPVNPVSAFSPINTFTMMPCANPTGVATTNVGTNSAVLIWDAVPGALSYKVRGRESGSNSYANITTTNNQLNVTGLDPSTQYEWTVRVVCANGVTSNASALQVFTTAGPDSKTGEWSNATAEAPSIYPNPANDQFSIAFNTIEELENVQIQLFDLQGKLVIDFGQVNVSGSVNMQLPAELRNGMYQIYINHDDQIFQNKLIIAR